MRIALEDVELEVTEEGAGRAIVLLHDFGLAKEAWDGQAAALSAVARVVRFDLRGMGRSSAPPGPYLMEQLAGDVAGVFDRLGIDRAIVAGHGAGGFVALAFFRMFAERSSGLALISTRGDADDTACSARRFALAERVESDGVEPLLVLESDPRARDFIAATDPGGAAAMLRGIAMRSTSEDLYPEIDVPVSVVAGTSDPDAPASRAIAEGIASARLDLLDGGHYVSWEAPDALTAVLEGLLRQ